MVDGSFTLTVKWVSIAVVGSSSSGSSPPPMLLVVPTAEVRPWMGRVVAGSPCHLEDEGNKEMNWRRKRREQTGGRRAHTSLRDASGR